MTSTLLRRPPRPPRYGGGEQDGPVTTVSSMSSAQASPHSHLHQMLFHASTEEPYRTEGTKDARAVDFARLVSRFELLLDGEQAKYATHNFGDVEALNSPLKGCAIVISQSWFASAQITGQHPFTMILEPLDALTFMQVTDVKEGGFQGATPWEGHVVELTFPGQAHSVTLPRSPSTATNAREFESLYPDLIKALRAPHH